MGLYNRVLKYKEEIRAEIAKEDKAHAVAKVFELDTRTVKKALATWDEEDRIAALRETKAALENALKD